MSTKDLPEWLRSEIMERYTSFERVRLGLAPTLSTLPSEEEHLAQLGLDGSRLRRRYWKKVRDQ